MSHNNTKQLPTDVPNSQAALSTQLLWSKVIALSLSPGPLNKLPSQPLFKQLDPFESLPSFIRITRHHQLNTHNKLHPFHSYKQMHNPQQQTKMDSHFTNPTISSKNKEKGKQPAKASSSSSSSSPSPSGEGMLSVRYLIISHIPSRLSASVSFSFCPSASGKISWWLFSQEAEGWGMAVPLCMRAGVVQFMLMWEGVLLDQPIISCILILG